MRSLNQETIQEYIRQMIEAVGSKTVLEAVHREISRQEQVDIVKAMEAGIPLWKIEEQLDRRDNRKEEHHAGGHR